MAAGGWGKELVNDCLFQVQSALLHVVHNSMGFPTCSWIAEANQGKQGWSTADASILFA